MTNEGYQPTKGKLGKPPVKSGVPDFIPRSAMKSVPIDLIAENKKLKNENKVYKEMWGELKRKSIYERLELEEDKEMMFLGAYILKWKNGNCPEPECGFTECDFEDLEQKYLGGGE